MGQALAYENRSQSAIVVMNRIWRSAWVAYGAAPGGFAGLRQPVTVAVDVSLLTAISVSVIALQSGPRGSSSREGTTETPLSWRPIMKTEDAKALAESALDTLAAQLESGQSQSLTAYLASMGRFHRYSANNVLLIQVQRQDATRVAGFSAWRKLGRFVRRGEKGIVILVPLTSCRSSAPAPDNTGLDVDETRAVFGFKPGYVFDVSQTDGEPLPAFAEVTGDPGGYITALKGFVDSRGIGLAYANAELGSARGASLKGRILLRDDLSPAVEFSVLVHEVAHELLHAGDRRAGTSKTVRETEAEAVAFVVSHAIGLETTTAASDYIQLYSGDKGILLASLALIQRTAAEILIAIQDPGCIIVSVANSRAVSMTGFSRKLRSWT